MAKTSKLVSQRQRFEEAAREAGADETGEAFERAFTAIVPPKRRPTDAKKPKKVRAK
jgi:hypothetical protein